MSRIIGIALMLSAQSSFALMNSTFCSVEIDSPTFKNVASIHFYPAHDSPNHKDEVELYTDRGVTLNEFQASLTKGHPGKAFSRVSQDFSKALWAVGIYKNKTHYLGVTSYGQTILHYYTVDRDNTLMEYGKYQAFCRPNTGYKPNAGKPSKSSSKS